MPHKKNYVNEQAERNDCINNLTIQKTNASAHNNLLLERWNNRAEKTSATANIFYGE